MEAVPADLLQRLPAARLAVDTGLLVLIWLVQLIIYPSFLYADPERLVRWHGDYSGRISLVVVPLMLLQVALIFAQLTTRPDPLVWTSAVLVAGCWLSTFFLSVPLHGRIGGGEIEASVLQALVDTNWPRTAAWSLCWLLSCLPLLRPTELP